MSKKQILITAIIQNVVILIISFIWLYFRTEINPWGSNNLSYGVIFLWGIGGGLVLVIISFIIFLSSEKMKKIMFDIDELFLNKLGYFDAILISVIAGICEEFFFRGILLNEFDIFVVSFIFALLHIPTPKFWLYGLWAFFAGLYLGNIYFITKTLLAPILVHIVNNCVTSVLWMNLRHKFKQA